MTAKFSRNFLSAFPLILLVFLGRICGFSDLCVYPARSKIAQHSPLSGNESLCSCFAGFLGDFLLDALCCILPVTDFTAILTFCPLHQSDWHLSWLSFRWAFMCIYIYI